MFRAFIYVPRTIRSGNGFSAMLSVFRMSALASIICSAAFATAAQTGVVTQHNDNARTGLNNSETTLTPSSVNSTQFGKLFSHAVDGQIYAQPLYVPNVAIPGKGTHNVLIVVTEADSIYAFDADNKTGANSSYLWRANAIDTAHGAPSGATPVPYLKVSCTDMEPQTGITSTPVIDSSKGIIYLEAKSIENGSAVHRLHAIDITTGNEKSGAPTVITSLPGGVPGTGDGSTGGVVQFDNLTELNRSGLLLVNGVVFLTYASHCDDGPYHGWIFAYDGTTYARKAMFNTSPYGGLAGIWNSGAGPAADAAGSIYLITGNGSFDTDNPQVDYGDSFVKVGYSNGAFSVQDYFTPFNQSSLSDADKDLGSGGILLLPNQTGSHPHEMVGAGKEGRIYLIDRDTMTIANQHYCGTCTADAQIVQESAASQIGGLFSGPAYWNGTIYFGGAGRPITAIPISAGLLNFGGATTSAHSFSFPGASVTISSNGNSNGIVWAIDSSAAKTPGPAVLFAVNASNVTTQLYSSSENATRDAAGNAVKFAVPTVANGKVYVGASAEIDIYGLLAGAPPVAATPVITPGSETVSSPVTVTITDSTSSATIHYTTDGSSPKASSTEYSTRFTLTTSATVKATAVASGFTSSAIASVTYTIQKTPAQVATPKIAPSAGTYTGSVSVSITDSTSGSTIYYTTNGNTPTTGSTQYTKAFTLTSSATVKSLAVASGLTNSAIASNAYTLTPAGPGSVNFSGGFAGQSSLSLNGGAIISGSRLRLTDGSANEARSAFYATPVSITNFVSDFSFQITNPGADGMTFTVQGTGTTAVGPPGGGLGYGPDSVSNPSSTNSPIGKSVAIKFDIYSNGGEGPDSTGAYTNGASPTTPSTDLTSSGVNLRSGDVFNVHVTYDGATLMWKITDATTAKTFTTSKAVNIPSLMGATTGYVGFTGGTGGSSSTQEILNWTFGSGLPIQYETDATAVFNASHSSSPTYRIFTWDGFKNGSGTTLDGTASGQSVSITLNVAVAGLYDVKYAVKKHNTRGIVQLTINGSKVGPVEDQYAAPDAWQEFDVGTVSLAAGSQTFVFTTTSKNASSSGYTQAYDYIKLTPQ